MGQVHYSTWRPTSVEINAGETKQVAFYDTKPNIFHIQNDNNTTIYISVSDYPTPEKYMFKVNPNSSDVFGQPQATGQIFIHNPSASKIVINIHSVADNFNAMLLKNFSVQLDNLEMETAVEFKAGAQLPEGMNTIGRVNLGTSAEDFISDNVSAKLQTIAENTADINFTEIIDKIKNDEILAELEGVTELLDFILEKLNKSNLALKATDYFSQLITTTSINLSAVGITSQLTVICDGNDLKIEFFTNASDSTASNYFVITKGEIFENIDITNVEAVKISAFDGSETLSARVIGR